VRAPSVGSTGIGKHTARKDNRILQSSSTLLAQSPYLVILS